MIKKAKESHPDAEVLIHPECTLEVLELADWAEIDALFKGRHYKYKDITEDIFKEELRKTTKWATTYGAGYVGENYFTNNILRMKHYNLEQAKEILNGLVEQGIVNRNQEEHDGHSFSCLSLNEDDGEEGVHN